MKRFFVIAIIFLVGISAVMAQKDVKAFGLNINYGSEINNLGLGAKFQYGITDKVRIEPSLNYYLEKDGYTFWDINANFHYLFDVAEGINVYPLVGIGYANVKYSGEWSGSDSIGYMPGFDYLPKSRGAWNEYEGESSSSGEIAINLGVGVDYQLNDRLSVGSELKYQIISNSNQFVFTIGATYKF